MSEPKDASAPYVAHGHWQECVDIVRITAAQEGHPNASAAKRALGYELWSQGGQVEDNDAGGLCIKVFARPGDAAPRLAAPAPRFLVEIDGGEGGPVETVYAAAVTDALDLLARWAPAVESTGRAQAMYALQGIRESVHRLAGTQGVVQEHLLPGVTHYLEEISRKMT